MRLFSVLLCVLVLGPLAAAQSLSGTYTMQTSNGTFTLTLQESGNQLTGELTGATGVRMRLEGQVEDGVGMGVIRDNQGGVYFETFFEGSVLMLMLIEPDANNMPDYSKMRQLAFQRSAAAPPPVRSRPQQPAPAPKPDLSVGISGGAGAGANPLARPAPKDPFTGTFQGDGLTLTITGSNGQYSGTLVFGGNQYPVQATGSGSSLTGSFNAGGSDFPFSATVSGSSMKFETGGATYNLKGSGAPATPARPANPLQKSGGVTVAPANRAPKGYTGGGNRITDEQAGVSLAVPSGWKAQQVQGGYMMGSDTHKGLILISQHNYSSVQQMQEDSGEGILDNENNVSLMFTGTPISVGTNGLGCEMSGTVQGTQARAYTVGLVSPHGGGILILAMTTTEAYTNEYRRWAEEIAASAQFTEPKLDTSLMQWFAGRYWRFTSSSSYSGSYSTDSSKTFCANGLYQDAYESGGSGTGSDQYGNQTMAYGAVGTQQGRARWTIRGNKQQGVITIMKPDGNSYDINYKAVGKGQDMYFDGVYYCWADRGSCN